MISGAEVILLRAAGQSSGPCDNYCFCRAPARHPLPHLVVQGAGELSSCLISLTIPFCACCNFPFAQTTTAILGRLHVNFGTPKKCGGNVLQGARIGKGGYIDSLDVCDFDLITIGDNVVVNEGSTIIGHFFRDGQLHFSEVCPCTRMLHRRSPYPSPSNMHSQALPMHTMPMKHLQSDGLKLARSGKSGNLTALGLAMQIVIGDNCSLAPFSMAKAGTVLPSGASIGPQATGPADPKKRAGKAPVLAALKTQLASPDLTAAQTAGLQVLFVSLSLCTACCLPSKMTVECKPI